MCGTREPSSAAWMKPMSSAPDCNCCIIAGSLPSWPEWNTVNVKRPLVAALSSSPNLSAALFQEWPFGVIRPRRNSLAWASASDGANTDAAALAARKRRRESGMVGLLWDGLFDEDQRERRIEREQHQQDARDDEERQRHHEHLAGLGTGDGGSDEEAEADRRGQQSEHQVDHHDDAEVARVDVIDVGRDRQQ